MHNYESLFGEKYLQIFQDFPEQMEKIENRIVAHAVTICDSVSLEIRAEFSDCNTAEALKINSMLARLHIRKSLTKFFHSGKFEFMISITQTPEIQIPFDICCNDAETLKFLCLAGGRTKEMERIEDYFYENRPKSFRKVYHKGTIEEISKLIMYSDLSITDEQAETKAEKSVYELHEIAFHGWDTRLFLEKILSCHEKHWVEQKNLRAQVFSFLIIFRFF